MSNLFRFISRRCILTQTYLDLSFAIMLYYYTSHLTENCAYVRSTDSYYHNQLQHTAFHSILSPTLKISSAVRSSRERTNQQSVKGTLGIMSQHVANSMKQLIIPHSSYNLDLAFLDFYAFSSLKEKSYTLMYKIVDAEKISVSFYFFYIEK